MLFDGKAIQVELDKNNVVKVTFDIKEGSANVIGSLMISDFEKMVEVVENCQEKKGVIFRSNKEHFIFGADITEFLGNFAHPKEQVKEWIFPINKLLNRIEDLNVPTVTLINGFALGGGFETCLMTDYRLAAKGAKVGLPETKLGIMPGWGGSVRLPRLCGADHAIEWITSGKQWKAEDAFKIHAVDAVVDPAKLDQLGDEFIQRCIEGKMDWKSRKEEKKAPLTLNKTEQTMAFMTAKGFVAGMAGPNYPAPVTAIEVMEKSANMTRDEALAVECDAFATLATSDVAENLIQVFLGDQYLKKVSKKVTKGADKIKKAAVLGAGIMGGGIAYQSASTGTPILMKDINDDALMLGLNEAKKLLNKQIERKKITPDQMGQVLNAIDPTLHYEDFEGTQVIVEAIVENKDIKKKVLPELESKVPAGTVIASNTSTINITDLATSLKRPEDFCGMHFFNPVHRMPLVEVIRGEKTSNEAVAKTVQYALQMKKTPIVVNDCPGFLVNRVLFPYFNGFARLLEDGVDYKRIDKVMEKFGWPMGPAYLMDVVGIDTGVHAAQIMADAFPDRMKMPNKTVAEYLFEAKRYGQKNGVGFYSYAPDRKGKPKKSVDPSIEEFISKGKKNEVQVSDEEIVERMMLPMIFECARCLEENIVGTPQEVDMGLVLGLGFPPFRAGALKYADSIGLNKLSELSAKYIELGQMYAITDGMKSMAQENKTYYQGKK